VFTSPSNEVLLYLLAGALILLIVLLFGFVKSLYALSKAVKANIVHEKEVASFKSELMTAEQNADEVKQRNVFLERENRRLTPYINMPKAFDELKQRRAAADKHFLKATQNPGSK